MKWKCCFLSIVIGLLFFICQNILAVEVTRLVYEKKTNPIGVMTSCPRPGWTFSSSDKSITQGGYRICVSTSIDRLKYPDLWDTGPTRWNKVPAANCPSRRISIE